MKYFDLSPSSIMQNDSNKKTIVKINQQPTTNFVAEQLTRIFIEQAKWKRASKKEKQLIENRAKTKIG